MININKQQLEEEYLFEIRQALRDLITAEKVQLRASRLYTINDIELHYKQFVNSDTTQLLPERKSLFSDILTAIIIP